MPEACDYDVLWRDVYGDMQRLGPVHRHRRRLITRLLADLAYETVLDVGCGPAENYDLLSRGRRLARFDGIDVSEVALAQARRAVPSGQFWNMDIQRDRPAGSWDLVYCSLLLEHLPDDAAALAHLRAMTKRYALLTTIGGDFERYRRYDEIVGHVRNYSPGELESKLSAAGFRVTRSISWGFPFYSPITRMLLNRKPVGIGSYGVSTRLIARLMYAIYFLNSRRAGDLRIVLAEPDGA